jgi:signal peptidase I
MGNKTKLAVLFCSGILVLGIALFNTTPARAVTCDTNNESLRIFDGFFVAEGGEFPAYIKLGRSGQTANASLSSLSPGDNSCTDISTVQSSDTTWTYAGNIRIADGAETGVRLALEDPTANQDASSPVVLIKKYSSPTCQDPNSCIVSYEGKNYSLLPTVVSSSFNTLKIATLDIFDPAKKIKSVSHYQDGNFMYKLDKPGDFNLSYVTGGEHLLSERIVFSDGTTIRRSESVVRADTVTNTLLPVLYRQRTTILVALAFVMIYAVYILALTSLRKLYQHRKWLKTHIAANTVSKQKISSDATERYQEFIVQENKRREFKLLRFATLVPLFILGIFIVINAWVFSIFSIDGISMETTFQNRSKKLLYKLPVAIGRLTKNDYIPKRGEVVVFRKDTDNSVLDEDSDENSEYVVKRVLAFSGERVVLKGSDIIVFNKEHPEGMYPDKGAPWESVLNGTDYYNADFTLKDGEILVVGDDRDHSTDSRSYGPIFTDQIVGRVLYRHNPNNRPYIYDEKDL